MVIKVFRSSLMLVSLLTANLLEIELNKQFSCCFVYYNKRFRERCAIQERVYSFTSFAEKSTQKLQNRVLFLNVFPALFQSVEKYFLVTQKRCSCWYLRIATKGQRTNTKRSHNVIIKSILRNVQVSMFSLPIVVSYDKFLTIDFVKAHCNCVYL